MPQEFFKISSLFNQPGLSEIEEDFEEDSRIRHRNYYNLKQLRKINRNEPTPWDSITLSEIKALSGIP